MEPPSKAYSVVVEEGETVVLPARWWHWAKSLTPSITLMRCGLAAEIMRMASLLVNELGSHYKLEGKVMDYLGKLAWKLNNVFFSIGKPF